MRILYLHQYFTLPSQPGGTRSFEMGRRLVEFGHDVDMITSDYAPPEGRKRGWQRSDAAGISVHSYPVPYSNAMSYPRRIAAFAQFAWNAAQKASQLDGDLVFATSTPLTIALPAVYACRRQRIPMVFEVRDLWPELPIAVGAIKGRIPIGLARQLEQFAYRHSSQIVALSPGMKSGIADSGYPQDRIHVIPNAADLELFDVAEEVGQQFRKRFPWIQDRPLVVYAGTIGRVNGVDYLARLAAVVGRLAPQVCFLVIGQGGEARSVAQTATRLGVLGQNFYMLESLPKEEMPMVLAAATVATSLFIDLPQMWANSANKFFDALASGTPVAINYRGWQADLLADSGAGVVLDVHDLDAAAKLLVQKLQDRAWLQQAGLAARRLAEQQFSRDMLARQLEAVLLLAAQA